MVDPIKGSTEVNLQNPKLMPTFHCAFQCMEYAQKCLTGTQNFSKSKLGGWKHTTAFHKSSDTNRHQTLKHLRQLLLLLLKKTGNARPGEGDLHPISPKTPALYYQPIEEKKRKEK